MNNNPNKEKELREEFADVFPTFNGGQKAIHKLVVDWWLAKISTLLEEKWKEIATYKRLSEDVIDQAWNAALSKAQQILKSSPLKDQPLEKEIVCPKCGFSSEISNGKCWSSVCKGATKIDQPAKETENWEKKLVSILQWRDHKMALYNKSVEQMDNLVGYPMLWDEAVTNFINQVLEDYKAELLGKIEELHKGENSPAGGAGFEQDGYNSAVEEVIALLKK